MLDIDWKLIWGNNLETLQKFLEYYLKLETVSYIKATDTGISYFDEASEAYDKVWYHDLNRDILKIITFFDDNGLHIKCAPHMVGGKTKYYAEIEGGNWAEMGNHTRAEAYKAAIEKAFEELKIKA